MNYVASVLVNFNLTNLRRRCCNAAVQVSAIASVIATLHVLVVHIYGESGALRTFFVKQSTAGIERKTDTVTRLFTVVILSGP